MADHLASARQLNLVSAEGDITAVQLYKWGREARTPAYMSHVAQRLKLAKLSQQAPAVLSTEDQTTLETHKLLHSMYLADMSHSRAKHEVLVADACQAPEAVTAEAAQHQVDLENIYGPITKLGKFSDSELLNACYAKAEADGIIQQDDDKSDSLRKTFVVERYSPMVIQDELVRCYQIPANEAALHKVAKDHLGILEQEGDVHAAKKFKTLLGARKI